MRSKDSCSHVPTFHRFFVFNCYRLGIGIEAEWSCTEGLEKTVTLKVANEDIPGNSTLSSYVVNEVDSETNETTLIGNPNLKPIKKGFHVRGL